MGRDVYRGLVGKPEGKETTWKTGVDGRIILKWIIRKRGDMDWIDPAQGRERWQELVNAVMNLSDSIKFGKFLD